MQIVGIYNKNGEQGYILTDKENLKYITREELYALRAKGKKLDNVIFQKAPSYPEICDVIPLRIRITGETAGRGKKVILTPNLIVILAAGNYEGQVAYRFWHLNKVYTLTERLFKDYIKEHACAFCNFDIAADGCIKPSVGTFIQLKNIRISRVESLKNLYECWYRWLDNNTFVIEFNGGTDEDGDTYSYLCEYHKDTKTFIFERMYEDESIDALFTGDQKKAIMQVMNNLMTKGSLW